MAGEFFGSGGMVMYVILGASVLALGVFIERIVYFLKTREPVSDLLQQTLISYSGVHKHSQGISIRWLDEIVIRPHPYRPNHVFRSA